MNGLHFKKKPTPEALPNKELHQSICPHVAVISKIGELTAEHFKSACDPRIPICIANTQTGMGMVFYG
jgi:hypothetical protein